MKFITIICLNSTIIIINIFELSCVFTEYFSRKGILKNGKKIPKNILVNENRVYIKVFKT